MFCDLNILYPTESTSKGPKAAALLARANQTVEHAYKLGYQIVALNQVINTPLSKAEVGPIVPVNIKAIPRSLQSNPALNSDMSSSAANLLSLTKKGPSNTSAMFQLKRLTIIIDDTSKSYELGFTSKATNEFDILAVQPTSANAFQMACSTLEVDIISLDMSGRLPFWPRAPMVNQAISRGIHFEIVYAPAIDNGKARRHLMAGATHLHHLTRGKNLILSSQAKTVFELRAPYDVINLGFLFKLNAAEAKSCLTSEPRAVLYHAETRKHAQGGAVMVDPGLKPQNKRGANKSSEIEEALRKRLKCDSSDSARV
ncbi:RNA-binding RNA processing protein rpp1 [Dispira simplex]|nr:RNA-binding RNA processing protein rpp1 [Dispira simplex]